MKSIRLFAMILAVTMLFSVGIQADNMVSSKSTISEAKSEKGTVSKDKAVKETVAEYKVAQLLIEDMNASKVQEISKILSTIKGVEAVKVDKEAKSLMVTHNAKLNFTEEAMPVITKAVKGIELKGIEATKAPAKGKCAGCPSKGKCGGAKKIEKTSEAKTSCGGK